MRDILPLAQILVSVVLMVLILLQQRGQALGSAFGGEGGGFYATRRGMQKKIFTGTVIFGALFVVLALLNFIL